MERARAERSLVHPTAASHDRFGSALAAANLGRSPEADLAIGVPNENVRHDKLGEQANAGAVNVLYGAPSGLTDSNNKAWYQSTDGVRGSPGVGDRFGAALAATERVLAIGVPFESLDGAGHVHAGAVTVLNGNDTGGLT